MGKLVDTVRSLAEPVAAQCGCEVWDVEYVREAGAWYLRVYIDKPGGVGIDDCEAVSRALDPVLDEADPVPGSYVFEVSSAGAERELKRPEDFARFLGAFVEVKLYKPVDGQKSYTGDLAGYENGAVTLCCAGTERTFEKNQVALVRLRLV